MGMWEKKMTDKMNESSGTVDVDNHYPCVFSNIDIGKHGLKNRIIFPAIHTNYANTDGTVSDKLLDFYTAIADGGCGLIFTGAAVVSSDSVAFERVLRIDSDECMPGLRKLFSEIDRRGAVPGVQLIHYGRQALSSVTGCDLIAPSAIPCPVMSTFDEGYRVREMTLDDIGRVRNDFIQAAVRAQEAGAKVVEVHAAHGYLLNEFLSPYSNHRTDKYGDTPEARARLIVEIIEGIRNRLGDNVAISVRVSGNEFVSGGLVPQDFKEIIPMFEAAGMDLLNVSAGVAESSDKIIPLEFTNKTPLVGIASELKMFASVPVCAVGSILSLEAAEGILSTGHADLVAMGRAQVADPSIVAKSAAGRGDDINRCIQCNRCAFWARGDPYMCCTVNPALG